MTTWEKIIALLASRKFWAMVTAIVAAAAALATNQIDTWQFIIAVVASMAAFSGGVAIEDAGAKIGAGLASSLPPVPCPPEPTPLQVPEAGGIQGTGADHG